MCEKSGFIRYKKRWSLIGFFVKKERYFGEDFGFGKSDEAISCMCMILLRQQSRPRNDVL